MPFDLQTAIAGHHAYFHGRQTITHRPKNPTGPDVECYGHRGAVDKARLSLYGGTLSIEELSCTWEVWGSTAQVNNGDILIDSAGVHYLVVGRFYSRMTSRWECACQQI